MAKYKKMLPISLKNNPELSEKWVQEIIADDPSILGLGDLYLRDQERIQPKAGRLDLLFQDTETKRRYEVELQLGSTDEKHIIRTIEYWDIERKRYPQYDHCAVIVAEDITSRFLNVISLFNGSIPLIAIQMKAIQIDNFISLAFTTVLDELTLGLVDEDEEAAAAPSDRPYWEKKGAPSTVKLADEVFEIAQQIDATLSLNYNKHYIGLKRDRQSFNILAFRPKKSRLNLDIKIPRSEETDAIIEKAELETLEYNTRDKHYRFSLSKSDISKNKDVLKDMIAQAYELRNG